MSMEPTTVGLEPQIMDSERPQVADEATTEAMAKMTEAVEARKAAKREAAKRFSEKKAAERLERVEKAKKFIEKLKAEKLWEKIGKDNQEFLDKLATVSNNNGIASTSTFTMMFGADVKVGSKVTLLQAFERTRKGQNEIDRLVRSKWLQKGIIVKYTRNDKDIFKSTYEVMELPLPQ